MRLLQTESLPVLFKRMFLVPFRWIRGTDCLFSAPSMFCISCVPQVSLKCPSAYSQWTLIFHRHLSTFDVSCSKPNRLDLKPKQLCMWLKWVRMVLQSIHKENSILSMNFSVELEETTAKAQNGTSHLSQDKKLLEKWLKKDLQFSRLEGICFFLLPQQVSMPLLRRWAWVVEIENLPGT